MSDAASGRQRRRKRGAGRLSRGGQAEEAAAACEREEEAVEAPTWGLKKRKGGARRRGEAPVTAASEAERPAKRLKRWKTVEMGVEMLKEFEAAGGLFLEEVDADEVRVTYADASVGLSPGGRGKKPLSATLKARRKQKGMANERPPKAAAGGQDRSEEAGEGALAPDEEVAPEMCAWIPYELHPSLLIGLARLGFARPTPVQARCLMPAIRQRKDLVGAAETGSGKTLAFGLPILHHTLCAIGEQAPPGAAAEVASAALGVGADGPKGLVILPTRELAVQVQKHLNAAAAATRVRTECVVGGMSLLKQHRLLRRQPLIVVGTPGRLFALLGLGQEPDADRCDWFRSGLRALRHLVLDEADRLVESGHFKELDGILAVVYNSVERTQQLQTFIFSATLTLDPRTTWQRKMSGDEGGGKVGTLMRRLRFREARAVHIVDLTQPEDGGAGADAAPWTAAGGTGAGPGRLPEKLRLLEAVCSDDKDRDAVLAMWLLRRFRWGASGGRVLLFVNAISSVLRLASVLALLLESPSAEKVLSRVRMAPRGGGGSQFGSADRLAVDVLALHSQMRQKDRLKHMERFTGLKHAVLVCTDIAARGLDVPDVAAVVHYQVPRGAEVFIHRSGRTARAGRNGESVAFVGPGDAAQWGRVYRGAGVARAQLADVGTTADELAAAREAVRLAADLEGKVHREAKRSNDKKWFRRAAREAELPSSEEEADADAARPAAPRRQLWGLYQQLQARVRRPPRRPGGGPLSRAKRGR